MEKYSRTYDLDGIKAAFREVDSLRMTRTARKCIVSLGFSLDDIVSIIQALKPQFFYKSMTTYADHRVWQDVYYAEFKSVKLYIKFMIDDEGHLIVSFKER
jgi:motility quorum-sensing regulator/GCU-specific mRNA interferase toxin